MLSKLRSASGETLVETLCSLLIITLSMMFLATALVSASRANAAFDADDVSFSMDDAESAGDSVVHFEGTGLSDVSVDVELFETGGGYVYYDTKD